MYGSHSAYNNPSLLLPIALYKISADYHLDLLSGTAHFMESGASNHQRQYW